MAIEDETDERPTATMMLSGGCTGTRLERRGPAAVVILHGAHMRAGIAIGERVFADLGLTVLVPSRPGYGRTPTLKNASPIRFADTVRELCQRLDIRQVVAVVAISSGGPTGLAMAARHPDFVERLVLQCSPGFHPWPSPGTRRLASVIFAPRIEVLTWAAFRGILRIAPDFCLRLIMCELSTRPNAHVLSRLDRVGRRRLRRFLAALSSGHGFLNDLRHPTPDVVVRRPTLLIVSANDGAIPFKHAESLLQRIPGAELFVSDADSHLMWFGQQYQWVEARLRSFVHCNLPGVTDQRPGARADRR